MKHEVGCQVTSTPKCMKNKCTGRDSPDISCIQPTCTSLVTATIDSLAELERSFQSQLPADSTVPCSQTLCPHEPLPCPGAAKPCIKHSPGSCPMRSTDPCPHTTSATKTEPCTGRKQNPSSKHSPKPSPASSDPCSPKPCEVRGKDECPAEAACCPSCGGPTPCSTHSPRPCSSTKPPSRSFCPLRLPFPKTPCSPSLCPHEPTCPALNESKPLEVCPETAKRYPKKTIDSLPVPSPTTLQKILSKLPFMHRNRSASNDDGQKCSKSPQTSSTNVSPVCISNDSTKSCSRTCRAKFPSPALTRSRSCCLETLPRSPCSDSSRSISPCASTVKLPCSLSPHHSSSCPETPKLWSAVSNYFKSRKKSPLNKSPCPSLPRSPCKISPRQSPSCPGSPRSESPCEHHRQKSPCSRFVNPSPPCSRSPCPRSICNKSHDISSHCLESPSLSSPCPGSPSSCRRSVCPQSTCGKPNCNSCRKLVCPQRASPPPFLQSPGSSCPGSPRKSSPCPRSICREPPYIKAPCPRLMCNKPHRISSPCPNSSCPESPRLDIPCPRSICRQPPCIKSPCPRFLCSKKHRPSSPCPESPCPSSPCPGSPHSCRKSGCPQPLCKKPTCKACRKLVCPQQASPPPFLQSPGSSYPGSPRPLSPCSGSPCSGVPCAKYHRQKSPCPRSLCPEPPCAKSPPKSSCPKSVGPCLSCPGSPHSGSIRSGSLCSISPCCSSNRPPVPCAKSTCPEPSRPCSRSNRSQSPCPRSLCPAPYRLKPPCPGYNPCSKDPCPRSPISRSPCKDPPCPGSGVTLPHCPLKALRSCDRTSVAATLKDFINKIATYAAKYTEGLPEECIEANRQRDCRNLECPVIEPCTDTSEDRPLMKDARRCVQFKAACDALPLEHCGIEELYFNQEIKKNTISTEACDMCTNEDCHRPDAPCLKLINKGKDVETHLKDSVNMMFNGLLMCADSDASDFTKESGAGSSLGTSASGGGCDAARALYYHDKLLATLQVLQNREETVRVQAESLSVAEQRLATMKVRNMQMRRELDKNAHEIRALRRESSSLVKSKNDVCVGTQVQAQEVDNQKNMVTTLQINLSVIEDLYRECFYETAKQEELIENLRKSYLDVRLMEKEKSHQFGSLQHVVNEQKWSLERCQDVAMEVEGLKLEISNFLNNSNNDSGMWEDSLALEVTEDLRDIMQQLYALRNVLQVECTCGLQQENNELKQKNATLQHQVEEYQQRMCSLECGLNEKEETIARFKQKIEETNNQIQSIMQELTALQERERERQHECECLQAKMRQTEDTLEKRTMELEEMRQNNCRLEETIGELRQELDKADQIIKDNCVVRSEVSYLSQQVSQWRRQLAESEARVRGVEAELARARTHCRNIDTCYREKATAAVALQAQLEEAHARGAELCAEARRVVCAVRHWVRRMRATNAEQDDKIKEQEVVIDSLRKAIEENSQCRREFRIEPLPRFESTPIRDPPPLRDPQVGCSKCAAQRESTSAEGAGPARASEREERSGCRCSRVLAALRSRSSERPSSSSTASAPRRLRRMFCEGPVMRCTVQPGREAQLSRGAGAHSSRATFARLEGLEGLDTARTPSPTSELFEQVDRLQDAMTEGQRIWSRHKLNPRR